MKAVYERAVCYYETDRMGIVHHSNYIRWYEEARVHYMVRIGVPYDELEKRGILIPVLSVSSEYRKPFMFGDTFLVELTCDSFNGIKCSFEYNVINKATGELCNTGTSRHCFLRKAPESPDGEWDMRPVNIKREYPEIYEKMLKGVG